MTTGEVLRIKAKFLPPYPSQGAAQGRGSSRRHLRKRAENAVECLPLVQKGDKMERGVQELAPLRAWGPLPWRDHCAKHRR